jgi:hypothetical protein
MVKRAIAAFIGATIGALISIAFIRWMHPHADPNSQGCLFNYKVAVCASIPSAPEQAEVMPVACKDWLGGGNGEVARLSECLHMAREAKRRKELQRGQALAGSI